jgi:hypothetical protein
MTTHGAWFHLIVPRNFNDGRRIPEKRFAAIRAELIGQFGGVTRFEPPVFSMQGTWMGLGFPQTEDVIIIGAFARDINAARAFFDEAGARWKAPNMPDQEAILITETHVEVMLK